MKHSTIIILSSLLFSFSSFAMTRLPAALTDDLLKTVAIELLINNINENYRVTQLTAGRIDDNGFELAAAIVTIVKANGICMKIAASVRADTCTNVETNCKLGAHSLDCKENLSVEEYLLRL
ncbi:MAG: hypothetical protein A2504_02090 [Bdellovibrionales bacterium RIFOXYD12_FULL_39_22]|nr:MAG: hypothetical protein A2385_12115 [Bdellovibrionales bacterium RIFOXYB1_FULL_39_21]OFZ41387.1 MAG: hypothetical protein A2485_01285 [Bdellovibrionales bacterium RIFOXYC12_FULL_39_17]OFZ45342.1 MAG: hypothetical protein A2404_13300 [Bdellovibrionales bacterium RIFOXYC1_FULL_39_130]OFZ68785.1 MAG: hypothetical protein A2451_04180 [Bdellovibrionales bacterium RIFOXYC2_FULL_39_8]OFZ74538.1 MAG: hypothetical protein A2560_12405 [Bdellovibrionales bacterium RIFOXYD1_FULL_39_84]OFZ92547.1 MAG: